MSVPEKLNPFYMYGIVALASPGWVLGTYFGVLFGNILPANIVSALSVGLYGMFIAIIIPPSRDNKVIAFLVSLSMAVSFKKYCFRYKNHNTYCRNITSCSYTFPY